MSTDKLLAQLAQQKTERKKTTFRIWEEVAKACGIETSRTEYYIDLGKLPSSGRI